MMHSLGFLPFFCFWLENNVYNVVFDVQFRNVKRISLHAYSFTSDQLCSDDALNDSCLIV